MLIGIEALGLFMGTIMAVACKQLAVALADLRSLEPYLRRRFVTLMMFAGMLPPVLLMMPVFTMMQLTLVYVWLLAQEVFVSLAVKLWRAAA